jgi:23S rRNA pseudouridine1911/1915/1917 synthase
MCAKDDAMGNALQDMIRLRTVDRRYLTLVHGNVAHDTGLVDEPIARGEKDRLRMKVSDRPGARSSVTTFKVLERFEAGAKDDGYTLLECKLYTGRTHQIRVHMEYIRHCCVGDPMYRSGSDAAQLGLDRQFLHSYSLVFDHPISEAHLEFLDALPPDLQAVMDKLATRSMGRTEEGERILGLLAVAPRQSAAVQL